VRTLTSRELQHLTGDHLVTKLPWITTPPLSISTKDIGKPSYGIIKIPFYGSLTPNEELKVAKYMFSLKDETMSEAKIDLVTILLQARCDNTWTKENTLTEIKSFSLVEDLYSFLISERSGWQGLGASLFWITILDLAGPCAGGKG